MKGCVLSIALTLLGVGVSSAEESFSCADSKATVLSTDKELSSRICEVVSRSLPVLRNCHLVARRPLVIRVSQQLHGTGYIARFAPHRQEILLPAPQDLGNHFAADSAFLTVPKRDLFESIIVHEMVHALFSSTICGRETCLAGHEYLAYALQIDALPKQSRDQLLTAFPEVKPQGLEWFDNRTLTETPELFAVTAWRHFNQPAHGCDLVSGLVTGKTVFPSDQE
ncbi:hypothetical protein [Antarctobacter jejuensis]|uniref:hypothetical protein n=1 Tax=Antarctobacter jejuensis TaxID=1439938 RepID=UPI003FD300C5